MFVASASPATSGLILYHLGGGGEGGEGSPYLQHACLLTSLASSSQSRWWHFCLQPSNSSQGLIAQDVKRGRKGAVGQRSPRKEQADVLHQWGDVYPPSSLVQTEIPQA